MEQGQSEFRKGVFAAAGHIVVSQLNGSFEFEPRIVTTAELSGRHESYLRGTAQENGFVCVSRQFVAGTVAAEKVMWNHRG